MTNAERARIETDTEIDELIERLRIAAKEANEGDYLDWDPGLEQAANLISRLRTKPESEWNVEEMAQAMALEAGDSWTAKHSGETLSGDTPDEMREYWRAIARAGIRSLKRDP